MKRAMILLPYDDEVKVSNEFSLLQRFHIFSSNLYLLHLHSWWIDASFIQRGSFLSEYFSSYPPISRKTNT